MNTEAFISILIPMYNAVKTIERCLDSLCRQNPQVFEIMIIDDGSTDISYEVVQQYSRQFSYIHLYKQSNQGVAKTRQNLVAHAHGKYILFCDADDYLEQDAISNIYRCIIDVENKKLNIGAYIFGYNLVRKNGKRTIKRRNLRCGAYGKEVYSRYHVKGVSDLYWSALWNKCYRRDLCFKFDIHFEDQMEDIMFNIDYISQCDCIYISDIVVYNYVQIGESLTRSKKIDNEKSILETCASYNKLKEKTMKVYPREEKSTMKSMYYYYYNLNSRAIKLGNENVLNVVGGEYKEVKSALGIGKYYIELRAVIQHFESNIKSRLRLWLHR